jgi:hypothetical protein
VNFEDIFIHVQAEMKAVLNSLSNLIDSVKVVFTFCLTFQAATAIKWKTSFIWFLPIRPALKASACPKKTMIFS